MNIGNIDDGTIVPWAFRPVVSKGQRNQEPSLLAQKTSCARFFLEKDSFGQFLKARFLFYTLDCVVKTNCKTITKAITMSDQLLKPEVCVCNEEVASAIADFTIVCSRT